MVQTPKTHKLYIADFYHINSRTNLDSFSFGGGLHSNIVLSIV